MDRLRQLVGYISERLSVLSVSQRVAVGLCAALVAGSLLWLLQWSTVPEMVPLVNYEFSYSDLDAAEQALRDNGIPFKTYGTRIAVRPADRHNAVRLLYTAEALPEGSLYDMAAAVADQNPFQSPDARKYAQNYAKGNELAKIIATYPFVTKASVLINSREKRRIGGPSYVPTASVVVTLSAGKELHPEMIDGFGKLVAGAVAGLKPHNVNITDARNGRSYSVPHPDDAPALDYLSMVKKHETHLRTKILNKLADIPGILAMVSVELDTSKRVTQKVKHAAVQPKMESELTSEMTSASVPTEPGVHANLGQALTSASNGASTSTGEAKTEYFEPKLSETETIEQMPFAPKKVTATVSIPRSFLAGIFAARYPDKPVPKDDEPGFVAIHDQQIGRVRASVEKIVMAKDPQDVEVDVYPDMEWSAEGGGWSRVPGGVAAAPEPDTLDPVALARGYGPQVGLLMLAVMSLFMMTRIVRKSSEQLGKSRRGAGQVVDPPDDATILAVGPHAVGQAEVSGSMLAGKEVDAETLRYQEFGEEVSKLVEENPEGAANLLRRWIDDDTR